MMLWKSETKRAKARKLFDFIHKSMPDNNISISNRSIGLAIREFCYLSSHERLRKLADNTLLGIPAGFTTIKKRDVTTLEEFEEAFARYLESNSKQRRVHTWQFYMPFYINRGNDVPRPTRLRTLEVDFRIVSLSTVLKQVPRTEFMYRATNEHIVGRRQEVDAPKLCLVANSQGESWNAAWAKVEPAFDTIRGLFEFTFGYAGRHYDSHQKPRREVPHPMWLFAYCPEQDNKVKDVDFLVEPYYQGQLFNLTGEQFAVLQRNAKVFRQVPTEGSTIALTYTYKQKSSKSVIMSLSFSVCIRYCGDTHSASQRRTLHNRFLSEHFALLVKGEIWQLFYTKSTGLFRILGRHLCASSCCQQHIYGKMHLGTHPFVHLDIGHKCRAKTIKGSKK